MLEITGTTTKDNLPRLKQFRVVLRITAITNTHTTMGKVKEAIAQKLEDKRRKQINLAADNFLSDQEEGDNYDAYQKLCDASEAGNDDCAAADFVNVWQPLEYMTVAKMIEVIENAIVTPELPEIMKDVDWNLLREQKKSLLGVLENIDNVPVLEHLEGIVVFIDAIQDSAVDDYGLLETLVFGEDNEELEVSEN
jgi:hypothetical protein